LPSTPEKAANFQSARLLLTHCIRQTAAPENRVAVKVAHYHEQGYEETPHPKMVVLNI
jgi:hypothetical protein